MTNRLFAAAATAVVLLMNVDHDRYAEHWWWDNVCHFLSGFALGFVLPNDREEHTFLAIAVVWEAFEATVARLRLWERYDAFPEAPRSYGYDGWDFDHQVEDTILDTVMGYYGVKAAKRLKK